MQFVIVPLQHTSHAISQSREILKKCGIIFQEEYIPATNENLPAAWKVTTQLKEYWSPTLVQCLIEIIRMEVPAYVLRFALGEYILHPDKEAPANED